MSRAFRKHALVFHEELIQIGGNSWPMSYIWNTFEHGL